MRKLKVRIHTKRAVDLIRLGASDSFLMEKFGLSAKGLDKLFKKLIIAEEIRQEELDSRSSPLSQSQTVDLTRILHEPSYKAVINPDEVTRDIESGLSDVELMAKHSLSAKGLENLFEKLLLSAKITRIELDERKKVADRPAADVPELEILDDSRHEEESWPVKTRESIRGLVRQHKVLAAGIAGVVAGIFISAAAFVLIVGFDTAFFHQTSRQNAPSVSAAALPEAEKQVQDIAVILEAIASNRQDPSVSGGAEAGATALQDCLKHCKSTHGGGDELEKLELANCQKECLSTHSELFKKMRQRYHGRPE
ncbi:MAG TPA: hypothetical protein VK463_17090 [Desulfomonilaceae bacterium]|nr:hypothetical protein [Desulfomonilaceae bacterium]